MRIGKAKRARVSGEEGEGRGGQAVLVGKAWKDLQ